MKLNWGAYSPLSTIDDYGHSSVVLFFRGCDLHCWYCHNKHIQSGESLMDISEAKDIIKSSAPFVSSVTFSGGEPLMQLDALKELIAYAKSLKLEVCLYTSGNYPDALKEVMFSVDRIYLDLKLESAKIVNHMQYLKNAYRSVRYLEEANINVIITMVVFDTNEYTIDEVEDVKMFFGEHDYVMIQGIHPEYEQLSPLKMKLAFKHSFIRTKENGVEWNA